MNLLSLAKITTKTFCAYINSLNKKISGINFSGQNFLCLYNFNDESAAFKSTKIL